MSGEQDWREKYREAAGRLSVEEARWAKAQNVLRLLIGRLCLAGQGRDRQLDSELTRVGDSIRRKIDLDQLELMLQPLSAAVAMLDGHEAAARTSETRAIGAAPVADAAPLDPHAPVGDEDAFGATSVLDRLALLPELKPIVTELRAKKRETLNVRELAELLERVTRYATEQRAQVQREKLELEKLVQQTASRLEEITSHLTSELEERNSVQEDTELLNQSVTDEVEQIRVTAAGAPDLPTLRNQLAARLDAISTHFSEFRDREDVRIKKYRERAQNMRTRISVLERESRSLHESLREEQRMAMIDALTGIPNRAAYDDRIEQEFKRWKRFTRPVSLLAWDVDRFKSINDAYGHKAGDKVLRVIGQHLAKHVRDTDFVARYGGEEFVMLLVGTGTEEARVVADKIRIELAQLGFHFHDSPVAVTASCGITEFAPADTPDTVFDRADRALYKAKQSGRNCCVIG